MKKFALAAALMSFALSVSAASRSGSDQRGLGRCTYNADTTYTVPEAGSTLALASIGFAALGFASMAKKRKD